MGSPFYDAGLKVKRADEHIKNLYTRLREFSDTRPYSIIVNHDPNGGDDSIQIKSTQPVPDDVLLIIGDALHNLRSALDYALYGILTKGDEYSKFPIYQTRDKLVAAVNGGLKHKTTATIISLIVDTIQPYEGGAGDLLWHLHNLNIIDKHMLLLAKTHFDFVKNICAVDERGEYLVFPDWLIVEGKIASYTTAGHRNIKITHKGQATSTIVFGNGMPLAGQMILPTIRAMSVLVNQTIGLISFIWNQHSPRP